MPWWAGVAKNEMVLKNFRTVLQVLLIQQRNKDLLITRFLSSWGPLYRVKKISQILSTIKIQTLVLNENYDLCLIELIHL